MLSCGSQKGLFLPLERAGISLSSSCPGYKGEALESDSIGSVTAGKLPHPEVIPCESRSAGSGASSCGCDSAERPDWRTGSTISMALFCKTGIDNG